MKVSRTRNTRSFTNSRRVRWLAWVASVAVEINRGKERGLVYVLRTVTVSGSSFELKDAFADLVGTLTFISSSIVSRHNEEICRSHL